MWVFKPLKEEFEKDARCKSCDKSILWAITTNGARCPIDRPLVEMETKTFKISGGVEVTITKVSDRASHFATCPAANQFKRRSQK